jgi:hypothetical protein
MAGEHFLAKLQRIEKSNGVFEVTAPVVWRRPLPAPSPVIAHLKDDHRMRRTNGRDG